MTQAPIKLKSPIPNPAMQKVTPSSTLILHHHDTRTPRQQDGGLVQEGLLGRQSVTNYTLDPTWAVLTPSQENKGTPEPSYD